MPNRNRVLVIDDKREDGEAIVRRLWEHQVPCYFLHYSQDNLLGLSTEKKFIGIRIIFQDIALVNDSLPGQQDYTAAATGINQLLHQDNGPWLLAAWSTWGADADVGEQYARALFEHLQNRLPNGIRPYDYVVLDKSPYTANGPHSAVKPESELEQREKDQLFAAVQEVIARTSNLAYLSQWENSARTCASMIIKDLWSIASGQNQEQADQKLGRLLYDLAKAEDGTLSSSSDISRPLYQILSKLLYDKSNHSITSPIIVTSSETQNIPKEKLNAMLHWDNSTVQSAPGSIYKWPLHNEVNLGALNISPQKMKSFIIDTFVKVDMNKRHAANSDEQFLTNATLILMDITPACDHANGKAFWRRFLVGVRVKEAGYSHFYSGGKLVGENLIETPVFETADGKFKLIFNSKLVVSLSDVPDYHSISDTDSNEAGGADEAVLQSEAIEEFTPDVRRLECIGRLRDELLRDIQSWYGRMATRPGFVSFR